MEASTNDNDLLARWLTDELSSEEKARLEKDNQLDDLRAVTDDISSWSLPPMDTTQGLKSLRSQQQHSETKSEGRVIALNTWLRVAASIALLVVAFYGWDFFFNNEVFIQTGVAEKEEVTLPDGSTVHLDAASSLAYSKKGWEDDRKVLITGQAFLVVESGESFIVTTENGTISVLGTQFNVKDDDTGFSVLCFEGKVRVVVQDKAETLEMNQGVELTNGNLVRFESEANSPEWMQGFTSYVQAPLSEVVKDLKKYHNLDIDLPDRYKDLEFTGRFTHENRTTAVRSVFATMEINYDLSQEGKVDFQ